MEFSDNVQQAEFLHWVSQSAFLRSSVQGREAASWDLWEFYFKENTSCVFHSEQSWLLS